ncbi:pyridoxal phosphate-dependent aminotransferase [Paenarthrobacter nicotinovorans]|uniref:pyridoxal phosphate-dependent aminotransferase n=1 Tax=Paenarthrobacter nicotinovorans TaxID=29320 RepID=UPI003801147E
MTASTFETSLLAQDYPASVIRTVFEKVAQYENVTKLTVGEPDFDTPSHIVEAAVASLRNHETRYTPNAGIPELREAFARRCTRDWNRPVGASNVMVTVGGQEALLLAMQVALNPGDELLVPDPAYPNYHGQATIVGAKVVTVPLSPDNGFRMRAEDIEPLITPKTKAVLVNSPSNPLGVMVAEEELRKMASLAARHNFLLISDEVYDRITYDGKPAVSVAQLDPGFENYLVINSLSKSYAMTGWRTGFVVGPSHLIQLMPRMQEGLVSCTPAFIQRAAVAALEGPDDAVDTMVAEYQRRRDIAVAAIRAIPGVECDMPEGAFYIFADIRGTGLSSQEFSDRLLEEQRVAVIPGTAFGQGGEGFIRLCFAASDETIRTAIDGMAKFVESLTVAVG